jgi:hypothetical protein
MASDLGVASGHAFFRPVQWACEYNGRVGAPSFSLRPHNGTLSRPCAGFFLLLLRDWNAILHTSVYTVRFKEVSRSRHQATACATHSHAYIHTRLNTQNTRMTWDPSPHILSIILIYNDNNIFANVVPGNQKCEYVIPRASVYAFVFMHFRACTWHRVALPLSLQHPEGVRNDPPAGKHMWMSAWFVRYDTLILYREENAMPNTNLQTNSVFIHTHTCVCALRACMRFVWVHASVSAGACIHVNSSSRAK